MLDMSVNFGRIVHRRTVASQNMEQHPMKKYLRQSRIHLERVMICKKNNIISDALLQDAAGIICITTVKMGLLIGGITGTGIIMARMQDGKWSPPCALRVTGLSFGLIAGGQSMEAILVFTDRSLVNKLISHKRICFGKDVVVVSGPRGLGNMSRFQDELSDRPTLYMYTTQRGYYQSGVVELAQETLSVHSDCNSESYRGACFVGDILSGKFGIVDDSFSRIVELLKLGMEARGIHDRKEQCAVALEKALSKRAARKEILSSIQYRAKRLQFEMCRDQISRLCREMNRARGRVNDVLSMLNEKVDILVVRGSVASLEDEKEDCESRLNIDLLLHNFFAENGPNGMEGATPYDEAEGHLRSYDEQVYLPRIKQFLEAHPNREMSLGNASTIRVLWEEFLTDILADSMCERESVSHLFGDLLKILIARRQEIVFNYIDCIATEHGLARQDLTGVREKALSMLRTLTELMEKSRIGLTYQVPPQTLEDETVNIEDMKRSAEEIVSQVKQAAIQDTEITYEEMVVMEKTLKPELDKARETTQEIMSQPCQGTLGEASTIHHVMNSICKGMGKEMVLFESTASPNLPNSFLNLSVAMGEESQRLNLRLDTLEDVGVDKGGSVTVESLNQGKNDNVVQALREKLAFAHGVSVDEIEIQGFYAGSFGILYTVKNLAQAAIDRVQGLVPRLRTQFNKFIEAKVHPLFYRTHFDVTMFFPNQNKSFETENQTFQVGPPGNTREYKQPHGWYRYALNVLGRYDDGDEWLHPFQNPKMWYKAYHGTKQAKPHFFTGPLDPTDRDGDAKVNAIANIFNDGFIVSTGQNNTTAAYGAGVYCAPDPDVAYSATTQVQTTSGAKSFKFLIMCAVRPGSFEEHNNGRYWVVKRKEDIRPYGLLVKEV